MMQQAVRHFFTLRAEGLPYFDALRSAAFRYGVLVIDLERATSTPQAA